MHEMDVLLPANFNADSDTKNIQKVTLTNVTKGQKQTSILEFRIAVQFTYLKKIGCWL